MADESPHRLPEHAQDAGELPGWSGRSPPFPSRLPPPTCFTATAFTPTSLLACSNSWYPPPKLSPLFTTFTKAAGCVCCPTASLMYWQAAPDRKSTRLNSSHL